MDKDFVLTSIGSYECRIKEAEKRAINAVIGGAYSVALLDVAEAMSYKQAIDELKFQLEVEEVNNA